VGGPGRAASRACRGDRGLGGGGEGRRRGDDLQPQAQQRSRSVGHAFACACVCIHVWHVSISACVIRVWRERWKVWGGLLRANGVPGQEHGGTGGGAALKRLHFTLRCSSSSTHKKMHFLHASAIVRAHFMPLQSQKRGLGHCHHKSVVQATDTTAVRSPSGHCNHNIHAYPQALGSHEGALQHWQRWHHRQRLHTLRRSGPPFAAPACAMGAATGGSWGRRSGTASAGVHGAQRSLLGGGCWGGRKGLRRVARRDQGAAAGTQQADACVRVPVCAHCVPSLECMPVHTRRMCVRQRACL